MVSQYTMSVASLYVRSRFRRCQSISTMIQILKDIKARIWKLLKGAWAHGDFCQIDENTGGVLMFGRSDGTLNPNGVRFGSAEIYNTIESMTELEDSLCVGQINPKIPEEERVILFTKVNCSFLFSQIV
jgi:acyl-coenzyme A synthetase/AMP-(fatty) acid ligase